MIELTLSAEEHFVKLLKSKQSLILGTKRSGCSGLSYEFDVVEDFDHSLYQKALTTKDLPIFVEKKSLPYLKGLVIDFIKEGLQSQIVYNNPNEKGKCGCGVSFSV